MKYSLRKSFGYRRRKEKSDEDHVYPRIDANGCSNSNLNLVKPVKSKSFLQRRRRNSSPSSPIPTSHSSDKIKTQVFEPRYGIYSNDEDENDDDPFSSLNKTPVRPFDRFTYQIRKSFRNTLTRQRSRLESNNSNKRLLMKKNNENNQNHVPFLPPSISTGLTSPLPLPDQTNKLKPSEKQRKAPLAPTHMNQSISLPIEINSERQETDYSQNFEKSTLNRSLRTRFSFLSKKRHDNQPHIDNNVENSNPKLTFGQRLTSFRRSFHFGSRNSSHKGKRHLLSNE